MSRLELSFLKNLGETWIEATEGFKVQAYSRGRKIVDVEVGETYPYYDLASLTKIMFSASSLMFMHDLGRLKLEDPVARWVPWFPENDPARIRDLLSHSAGMTWWYPFYKTLAKKRRPTASPEEAWDVFQGILRKQILSDLGREKKRVSPLKLKSVYSDLDLFLAGVALESLAGTTLYTVWADVCERMGLRDTDFHRGNKPRHARPLYAPTEKDAWRGKTLQGEVHDENTWALQGVAPHAGLFGTINDVSHWGLLLRDGMRGKKSKSFATPETVAKFTKRAVPSARGDWALGFMMPTKGSASCGPKFSPRSVGHTGFTGTSIWYDPDRDLLVTILSNRVHPTRDNNKIRELRPRIHTLIVDEVSI